MVRLSPPLNVWQERACVMAVVLLVEAASCCPIDSWRLAVVALLLALAALLSELAEGR